MNLELLYNTDTIVYPPKEQVYRALELCPLEKTRVVILGQDPYMNPGQANGLAFSVNKGVKLPPSLKNIFKELKDDLGIENTHGDLEHWAKQGVLLLNTVLTVEKGRPGSHYNKGWEKFTTDIIKKLNWQCSERIIFVLWGKKAQEKKVYIDGQDYNEILEQKIWYAGLPHVIIQSSHPSPFSANSGFFGSKPFSKINEILERTGRKLIDWKLP